MPLSRTLHNIAIVGFLSAIFVAILWQGAPGYRLQAVVCQSSDVPGQVSQCCKDNPGAQGCETGNTTSSEGLNSSIANSICAFSDVGDPTCFSTNGGPGGPAPTPPTNSSSACNLMCFWGGPNPECTGCPCAVDGQGGYIYPPNCPNNQFSSISLLSSSSSSASSAASSTQSSASSGQGSSSNNFFSSPGSSSAGNLLSSSVSSSNSVSSAISSSSSTNTGPAPVPPQCPRTGFCDEICAGNFPNAMEFTLPMTQGQCSANECQPIGGFYNSPVIMRPDISLWDGVASCVFSAPVTAPTCVPPGTVGDKWVLKIYQNPQNIEDFYGFYYSDLSLEGMAHFRGRSPWRCDAINGLRGGSTAIYPEEPVCSFNQVGAFDMGIEANDDWCISSSSSSQSSQAATSSTTSSTGTSSTSSTGSATSASSSTPTTSSCDLLTCIAGGAARCLSLGYTTCSLDPSNPPVCHSCSGVRSSSSRSTSSTTALRSSSSQGTTGASSSTTTQPRVASSSANSLPPNTTSSTTTAVAAPYCGDSLINSTAEVCDAGTLNGDPSTNCATSCRLALGQSCTLNAQCDSGRCIQGRCLASCETDADCPFPLLCNDKNLCTLPRCGDGEISPGETCDLGDTCTSDPASCNRAPGTAGTTCLCDPDDKTCPRKPGVSWPKSVACSVASFCGDGMINDKSGILQNGKPVNAELGSEECDLGAQNGQIGSPCSAICTLVLAPFCGNNRLDPGERCDDGFLNGSPSSRCPSDCGLPPSTVPAGSEFTPPSLQAAAPTSTTNNYELPLLPVRVPGSTTADLTRIGTSRAPVAQTGPEALLAIALGAGFGWTVMRKKRS